jgi:hypothetical protein
VCEPLGGSLDEVHRSLARVSVKALQCATESAI